MTYYQLIQLTYINKRNHKKKNTSKTNTCVGFQNHIVLCGHLPTWTIRQFWLSGRCLMLTSLSYHAVDHLLLRCHNWQGTNTLWFSHMGEYTSSPGNVGVL